MLQSTTNDETPRTCRCCGESTDDVGPLRPIEGRYRNVCGDCYADIVADWEHAELGGYD